MKKATVLFLVALSLMLVAGCGGGTDSGEKATRDTSTLDKALIGHWQTSDRVFDVYITSNTITSYDSKGEQSARDYTVDSMAEDDRVVCLKEKSVNSGINETTYYQFSPGYDSMRAYRDAGLEKPLGDVPYIYVDEKTAP